jgi:hypothetical protein
MPYLIFHEGVNLFEIAFEFSQGILEVPLLFDLAAEVVQQPFVLGFAPALHWLSFNPAHECMVLLGYFQAGQLQYS